MRFLVTGHTGFKGAWLTLLLVQRGHEVAGFSLPAGANSLFATAGLEEWVSPHGLGDVRDAAETARAIRESEPDVVIHMAAQSLVRTSYAFPRETIDVNVIGTLSALEAIHQAPSVRAALMVTTDKVYRNDGRTAGFREGDALGGHDPYSASKAMADLLVGSWVDSFGGVPLAVARAGNVIGGGDTNPDRLFPDLMRGFASNRCVELRYPRAVRPWQHVLDCLNGYLTLVEHLLDATIPGGAWNFGPDSASMRTVAEAASLAAAEWGPAASWVEAPGDHPYEASVLSLDASKARSKLGWQNFLTFEESVAWTVAWTHLVMSGATPLETTLEQIRAFESRRAAAAHSGDSA